MSVTNVARSRQQHLISAIGPPRLYHLRPPSPETPHRTQPAIGLVSFTGFSCRSPVFIAAAQPNVCPTHYCVALNDSIKRIVSNTSFIERTEISTMDLTERQAAQCSYHNALVQIHNGVSRDVDAQYEDEYQRVLFGVPRQPRRFLTNSVIPTYVGNSKDQDDFLIDFDAPPRYSMTVSAELSASWDTFCVFPFLELPRELREVIYNYALRPSSESSVVEIARDVRPYPGYNPYPRVRWNPTLQYKRQPQEQLAPGLLRTCKSIYNEALPILYSSVTFFPVDNQALLPMFLEKQSTLARQSIRSIRLATMFSIPNSQERFHWAVTCAQIASLGPTLKKVEVLYVSISSNRSCLLADESQGGALMKAIIKPLCKIQCPKHMVFSPVILDDAYPVYERRFNTWIKAGDELVSQEKQLAAEGRADDMEKFCKEWDVVSDISSLDEESWEEVKADYYKYDNEHDTDSD